MSQHMRTYSCAQLGSFFSSHILETINTILYCSLFLGNESNIYIVTKGSPTYITPAPWAFISWSLMNILLAGAMVYQFFPQGKVLIIDVLFWRFACLAILNGFLMGLLANHDHIMSLVFAFYASSVSSDFVQHAKNHYKAQCFYDELLSQLLIYIPLSLYKNLTRMITMLMIFKTFGTDDITVIGTKIKILVFLTLFHISILRKKADLPSSVVVCSMLLAIFHHHQIPFIYWSALGFAILSLAIVVKRSQYFLAGQNAHVKNLTMNEAKNLSMLPKSDSDTEQFDLPLPLVPFFGIAVILGLAWWSGSQFNPQESMRFYLLDLVFRRILLRMFSYYLCQRLADIWESFRWSLSGISDTLLWSFLKLFFALLRKSLSVLGIEIPRFELSLGSVNAMLQSNIPRINLSPFSYFGVRVLARVVVWGLWAGYKVLQFITYGGESFNKFYSHQRRKSMKIYAWSCLLLDVLSEVLLLLPSSSFQYLTPLLWVSAWIDMIPFIFHVYLPAALFVALLAIPVLVAHYTGLPTLFANYTGLLAWLEQALSKKNDTVSQTTQLQYPECLIDTTTIQLVSLSQGHANPPYAILSHRWRQEEIDGSEDFALEETKNRIGYQKILKACHQARIDGYKYLWADTCCISKNPTKRSRDIQSMFAFYKNAAVCYVHLFDVGDKEYCCRDKAHSNQDLSRSKDCSIYYFKDQPFRHSCSLDPYHVCLSDWFCRGWTLQELIAPEDVRFFGETWNFIGTKLTLQKVLSDRTSIPCDILTGKKALSAASRTDRMTWAMGRMTTKPADQAYCLMGILDTFIEPQDDESVENAFKRLWDRFYGEYPTTIETGLEGVYAVVKQSAKHTALRSAILRD